MSGLFICLEGVDGAGKTTQASRLAQRISDTGELAIVVREPGSTALGEQVRDLVKHGQLSNPVSELMLFEAARAELMQREILPSLAAGIHVIADRFAGSTLAYQGHGRGIDIQDIRRVNDIATSGQYPDVTFLLDIDPAAGRERCLGRQPTLAGDAPDRFESQQAEFYQRVREGYLSEWRLNHVHDRFPWVLVDASRNAQQVAAEIWEGVRECKKRKWTPVTNGD